MIEVVLINEKRYEIKQYENIGEYIKFDFTPLYDNKITVKVPWTSILYIEEEK